jgi:hypothetical protein
MTWSTLCKQNEGNWRARILCWITQQAVKTYWSGGMAPPILSLGIRRRWVVNFTPRQRYLTPPPNEERAHSTRRIRSWVNPRAGLVIAVAKGKNPPCRESSPGCPGRSLVTILTELSRFLLYVTRIIVFNIVILYVKYPSFRKQIRKSIFVMHVCNSPQTTRPILIKLDTMYLH